MPQNTDRVDVTVGTKDNDDERVISIPRVTQERWPERYPLAITENGNDTAAAKRATAKPKTSTKRSRNVKDTTPGELPAAGDTVTGSAGAENTGSSAGTAATDTEGNPA